MKRSPAKRQCSAEDRLIEFKQQGIDLEDIVNPVFDAEADDHIRFTVIGQHQPCAGQQVFRIIHV